MHLYSYERIVEADRSFANGMNLVRMTPSWTTSVSNPDLEAAAKHAVLRGLSENKIWEHERPYLAMVLKLGHPRVDFIVDVKVTAEATTTRIETGGSDRPMVDCIDTHACTYRVWRPRSGRIGGVQMKARQGRAITVNSPGSWDSAAPELLR